MGALHKARLAGIKQKYNLAVAKLNAQNAANTAKFNTAEKKGKAKFAKLAKGNANAAKLKRAMLAHEERTNKKNRKAAQAKLKKASDKETAAKNKLKAAEQASKAEKLATEAQLKSDAGIKECAVDGSE